MSQTLPSAPNAPNEPIHPSPSINSNTPDALSGSTGRARRVDDGECPTTPQQIPATVPPPSPICCRRFIYILASMDERTFRRAMGTYTLVITAVLSITGFVLAVAPPVVAYFFPANVSAQNSQSQTPSLVPVVVIFTVVPLSLLCIVLFASCYTPPASRATSVVSGAATVPAESTLSAASEVEYDGLPVFQAQTLDFIHRSARFILQFWALYPIASLMSTAGLISFAGLLGLLLLISIGFRVIGVPITACFLDILFALLPATILSYLIDLLFYPVAISYWFLVQLGPNPDAPYSGAFTNSIIFVGLVVTPTAGAATISQLLVYAVRFTHFAGWKGLTLQPLQLVLVSVCLYVAAFWSALFQDPMRSYFHGWPYLPFPIPDPIVVLIISSVALNVGGMIGTSIAMERVGGSTAAAASVRGDEGGREEKAEARGEEGSRTEETATVAATTNPPMHSSIAAVAWHASGYVILAMLALEAARLPTSRWIYSTRRQPTSALCQYLWVHSLALLSFL